MTRPIGTVSAPTQTVAAHDTSAAKDAAKAKEVASEFEAILVRQLLSTTKMGGKENMYSDMTVDALAKAVTAGKGLGLASRIGDALSQAGHAGLHARSHAPAPGAIPTSPASVQAPNLQPNPSESEAKPKNTQK